MLQKILAISGKPGLYKMISNAKNSVIVESLVDGKRMPAYASARISSLEDISIFTQDGDVKLSEVFIRMYEQQCQVDPKAPATELKEAFMKIVPDYDPDRVYASDIKKVFAWYNLLLEKEIISGEAIDELKQEEDKADSESAEK